MEGTSYELKYCERCGSLGLRRAKSAESYCRSCGQLVHDCLSARAVRKWLRRKPEAAVAALPAVQNGTIKALGSAGRLP